MDFLFSHLGQFERQFNLPLQVRSIGHAGVKRDRVARSFDSMNFSFILQGGGNYRVNGVTYAVKAPCVITQWPGIYVEYGPGEEWEWWEELFLIYDEGVESYCRETGLASPDHPIWPIHDMDAVQRQTAELLPLDNRRFSSGLADRLDRICERMILESHLGEAREVASCEEKVIRHLRDYIDKHAADCLDFEELARSHQLSYSSFRRHWRAFMNCSPARYATLARMRQAKRLLVETALPIGEIATVSGYSDPMYFSRKFRQETGMKAIDYRRLHRQPLAGLN